LLSFVPLFLRSFAHLTIVPHRAVRATEFNEESSRSHAVLQLTVEVQTSGPPQTGSSSSSSAAISRASSSSSSGDRDGDGGGGSGGGGGGGGGVRLHVAKLNLVDLAGSEKWPTAKGSLGETNHDIK
jgi:hypothetical protein